MTLGEIAYSAYCEARQWKSVRGEPLPKFQDQSPELQEAWEKVGAALDAAVRNDTSNG